MAVADPFAFEHCCFNDPTVVQGLISDYYKSVRPYMNSILEDVYQREIFGKPTEEIYNDGNDFHYLLALLLLIYFERDNDAQWDLSYGTGCGLDKGQKYYTDKYNIDCIQKHFFCNGRGYDVSEALNIFGLNPDFIDQDGIGFMHISYSQRTNCSSGLKPFEVK